MNFHYTIIEKVGQGYSKDTEFTNFKTKKDVIYYIGSISSKNAMDDDHEIQRIIEMDEYGNVDFLEVAFEKGKLILQCIPKQG